MREALRILSKHDTPESLSQHLGDVDEFDDREIAQEVDEIDREAPIAFPERKPSKTNVGFWGDEEDDEFGQVFDDDDEFLADDITTPAHAQLDLHRDMREYQRRIAWDMPLLRSTSSPIFNPYSPL
jgi:small subunit ribosomal protein S35